MNVPINNNGDDGSVPRPSPPPLDATAQEQIEKLVDSIFADNRQRMRDMHELYLREISTMAEHFRGMIGAAVEQAGVAGLRERLLWMAIGAMGAALCTALGFGLGRLLRLVGSF